jgi:plasmid stabilization system protein ParE
MTRYRFTSAALSELKEATHYYEQQENGLGTAFLDEIDATVERILHFPHAWHLMSARTKRCRTHRFPFGLLFPNPIRRHSYHSRNGSASRSTAMARVVGTLGGQLTGQALIFRLLCPSFAPHFVLFRREIVSTVALNSKYKMARNSHTQANLTSHLTSLIINSRKRGRQASTGVSGDRRMPCRATLCSSLKSVGKKQLPITMNWLSLPN